MNIKVNDQIYVSEIKIEDKDSYIEHFSCREIYERTIGIPFPYGEAEAIWWINAVIEETRRYGIALNWAIREREGGKLIGGIGLMNMSSRSDHAAEIGYWLAKPYWNKGIMTNCVKKFVHWAVNDTDFQLVRIQARVFHFNEAATRTLEKAGFAPEGYMRKRFFKDGQYIDCKLYAYVR